MNAELAISLFAHSEQEHAMNMHYSRGLRFDRRTPAFLFLVVLATPSFGVLAVPGNVSAATQTGNSSFRICSIDSADDVLHITGTEIFASSVYEVQMIEESEANCGDKDCRMARRVLLGPNETRRINPVNPSLMMKETTSDTVS